MSDLSKETVNLLAHLKDQYLRFGTTRGWIFDWFFPNALADALDNYTTDQPTVEQAYTVCDAYLQHTWFFQRWIFGFLAFFSQNALIQLLAQLPSNYPEEDKIQAFNHLAELDANIQDIMFQSSQMTSLSFSRGSYSDEFIESLKNYLTRYPYLFRILNESNLFSPDIIQNTLLNLQRIVNAGLFWSDKIEPQMNYSMGVAYIPCERRNEAGILLYNLYDYVWKDKIWARQYQYPYQKKFESIEFYLKCCQANLLNGECELDPWSSLIEHPELSNIFGDARHLPTIRALNIDADMQILNTIIAFVKYKIPSMSEPANEELKWDIISNFSQIIEKLYNNELLKDPETAARNLKALFEIKQPEIITPLYDALNLAPLTQSRFSALIDNQSILFAPAIQPLWGQISPYRRYGNIDTVINLAETYCDEPIQGQIIVERYIRGTMLYEIIDHNVRRPLNHAQSTHTKSVHQTVSESATRLYNQYRMNLERNFENIILQLQEWIAALPNETLKVQAAKQGMLRLTAVDYHYIDRQSQVSTKQLLALFWLAIHDEAKRQGSLEDAKLRLLDGLYECQREYNLSENGVDDCEAEDESTCDGGTFNKLMEKLQGIHPAVHIKFITPELAALKLEVVAKQEAVTYLKTLTAEERTRVQAQSTLESIWDKIEDKIAQRLFEEFGSLYQNDIESKSFRDFVASGVYISPGDLNFLLDPSRMQDANIANNPYGLFHPAAAAAAAPLDNNDCEMKAQF